MREEEVAAKSRKIQVTTLKWRWSPRDISSNVRISSLGKESATGSTLRSHEQSVEHKDVTIKFSRRCN